MLLKGAENIAGGAARNERNHRIIAGKILRSGRSARNSTGSRATFGALVIMLRNRWFRCAPPPAIFSQASGLNLQNQLDSVPLQADAAVTEEGADGLLE